MFTLMSFCSLSNWLLVVLTIKIFPGAGEAEGETSTDKAAEVSCPTPVTERRSQCVYQAAEGKHAEH